jgi:hypothetical protein
MSTPRTIAYFSMEVGLETELPTYSGGLGVLAGDTIRSAADLKVPMVADSPASQDIFPMPRCRRSAEKSRWNGALKILKKCRRERR